MILPFDSEASIAVALPKVRQQFAAGQLIAYPTETVYGLGSPLTDAALERLAALKGRPAEKPFILLVSSMNMLNDWGFGLSDIAHQIAQAFWPGPLTLVLPNHAHNLPSALRGAANGIAVRWSGHAGATAIVDALNHPLVSTSANPAGKLAAVTPRQVQDYFGGELESEELLLLDGGVLHESLPSTVVDCTGTPRVLREGATSLVELRPYLDR